MDPGSPVIRLAVFGQPVTQSLSPRIHALFARQLGLKIDYQAIEATAGSFPDQVLELASGGGRGCNVTVPFKRAAWMLADASSDRAARAQAANTLVFNERIFADNTDGQGLVNDLAGLADGRLEGARVCVLGAGGAAAGILAALLHAQPEWVFIVNRTRARADDIARRHADLGRVFACEPADFAQHAPVDLVINATSQGHRGDAPAFSADWLAPGGLCYDLNYGPAAAPLRSVCTAAGIAYADGLGMLVNQAALSFQLWTGELPDVGPVLESLR